MHPNELKALVTLLEDPDLEIYQEVKKKILSIGAEISPILIEQRPLAPDPLTVSRIENLLSDIQFQQLKQDLIYWKDNNSNNLLRALLIINQYEYPDFNENLVFQQLAEIRQEIWIKLIYDMSPVEKVRLINHILYDKYKFRGNNLNFYDPNNSFIGKVLENKKGNPLSLACVYSIIAQQLDIPIYGINLPKHFMLAYIDEENPIAQEVLFYINGFNKGQLMKKEEIYSFLKQMNLPEEARYTLPCPNLVIVNRIIRNLISAYAEQEHLLKKEQMEELLSYME